jgi:hypothetical protein
VLLSCDVCLFGLYYEVHGDRVEETVQEWLKTQSDFILMELLRLWTMETYVAGGSYCDDVRNFFILLNDNSSKWKLLE